MPIATFVLPFVLLAVPAVPAVAQDPHPPAPADARPLRVLLMTGGGYHDFEGNAKLLLAGLAQHLKLDVTHLRLVKDGEPEAARPEERPTRILDAGMAQRFDVVLAYHQGEKLGLNQQERDSLLHFVRRGGGWVGLHCAADSFKWNREFVAMVGGKFKSHPPFGPITVRRLAGDAPVLAGIEDHTYPDEFYYLDECRLDDKQVVLVGEGPADKKMRPVAWTKAYGEGRVFYTIQGHGKEAFADPNLLRLVANALCWASARPHWAAGPEGWRTLFDGTSLAGWTQCGPGRFTVQDGALVGDGGMGLLWFHEKAFADFELELEWRLAKAEDNSGVFVRFPPPRDPWDAVRDGYEVQICDAGGAKTRTGSIYSFQDASELVRRPVGEWNAMRIVAEGQRYEVWVNGRKVCEYTGERSRTGHIGLQNHAAGEVVAFRNLRVRER